MTGIIYRVTSPSGKVYIGKTTRDLSVRKAAHEREALLRNNRTKFAAAVRKYQSLLVWDILYSGLSREVLSEVERRCIEAYQSMELGYNMTIGGDGGATFTGRSHTEKTRKKMSAWQKGKKHSIETIEKIIKTQKGRKLTEAQKEKMALARVNRLPPSLATKQKIAKSSTGNKNWLGKKHSPETLLRMSEAQKLRWQREKQKWL